VLVGVPVGVSVGVGVDVAHVPVGVSVGVGVAIMYSSSISCIPSFTSFFLLLS